MLIFIRCWHQVVQHKMRKTSRLSRAININMYDPEPEDSGLHPGSVHELCSQGCQGFQILRHKTSYRRNSGEKVKECNSSLALVV